MVVGVCQNLSNVEVNSSFGSYEINFQSITPKLFADSFFLIDPNIHKTLDLNEDRCLFISADEANKTLRCVEDILVQLSSIGMTKNNELVVIGGGYLQDIGTLVASLYMRGVKWSYVPTTLAAMGDSCIGGKSSINAGEVKNLVGNFYPPKSIFIDSTFISTLPNLELIAGFSEIIKICFARSFETFTECSQLISNWKLDGSQETITEIIKLSLVSKKYFVEEDEFDAGIRKLLNFGHSFGHALESASKFKIPHGVAVLIGMIAASKHPFSKPSEKTSMLVNTSLEFSRTLGKDVANELEIIDFASFAKSISRDKKNTNSDLVLILPMERRLEIVSIPFNQDAIEITTQAMKLGIEMVLNEIR